MVNKKKPAAHADHDEDAPRLEPEPAPEPRAGTSFAPAAGTGIGPHTITVTGTALVTTANVTKIVLKNAQGQTVGESGLGTATATTFTGAVMCEIFTPSGAYNVWLVQGAGGAQVPGTFTLTRNVPTGPGQAGTPAGFGDFERRFGLPNYRGRG